MKRPPGLWILLSAGVLWLSLQDVYGIRATALIFGKSSTSTSTTELPAADGVSPENSVNETATSTPASSDINSNSTNDGNSTSNSTGHVLTGNPQIDYVWDPNLPKELNGYNLSEYPFYGRVPNEVIAFKCDGLHDGFYASIPHKCQVYHQCLFGTRYDFLCANYTAFDQKTFICQFVSIVDCVNSKKFWHRNDDLYKAQSTTTIAPLNLRAAIYTTASPNGDDPDRRPQGGGGGGARRRPTRRRRPQFDYYDDEYYDDEEYYEERPRANRGRKRPRPRPRPVYEDEEDDEEYDDERYESRRTNTKKKPSRRRNKDRKKPEYDEDDAEVDDKFEDEDYVPAPKRSKPEDRRKATEEDEPSTRKRASSEKRRPPAEKREQSSDRKPPRKSNRRPAYDEEYEDELPQSDDSRSYEDRPRKKQREEVNSDGRPIIKPSTGTIYDRPRVAPRINLPVPKNAADKFAYTTKSVGGSTTTPKPEDDYEEYEEAVSKRPTNRRPVKESKKPKNEDSKSQSSGSRHRTRKPEVEEEVVEKSTIAPKPRYNHRNRSRPSTSTKKPAPVTEEYEDEEYLDEEVEEQRPISKNEKKTTTTTTSTTTTTTEAPRKEPMMRIIKRPFLPSRGGSPYSSRGLQPIGLKAVEKPAPEIDSEEYIDEEKDSDYAQDEEAKPEEKFKPSPVLIKVPARPNKYTEELIDIEPSRQQTYKARTTQRPKNLLDLNEYDVTLNDALNPTLPNLPVRAFPTGFSSGIDYSNGFQRTRYLMEPNQNYLYNNKVAKSPQRYEAVPQGQYSTLNAGYRQPQTQALYSGY